MDTVRWGLLSTANINRRVIPSISSSERGKLAAVASRSAEKARAYAKEWEIPRWFDSYEAMLNSDEVDAVYISLPNHLHAEWSVRALQAGKHVLCEKPFALTVEEVDRMIAASRENGRALMEAFMYRHHPQMKMVGEWVRSGRLGEISLVRAVFNFSMGNRTGNVRLEPDYGGGALWDVGVYPLSFAQYIYDEVPQWVSGAQWIGKSGVDESFAGLLRYTGGGMAQIACAFRSPFYTQAEVIGTEGSLTLTRPFTEVNTVEAKLIFSAANGEFETLEVPDEQLYQGEIENMQDAILEGKSTYIGLEESRKHIQTAQALYQAARSGQTVWIQNKD